MNRGFPLQQQGYRWWILGVSTVTQLIAALASQGIGAWSVYAQDALHLSTRQIGSLATLLNIVQIFGLALVGGVLDRRGERMPVFIGMVVLGWSMTLLSVSAGFGVLAVAMLLMGVGYSPIQPGGSKAIYHWFAAQERGLAMGIRQAALPLGGACAAVFFPQLISRLGWTGAMAAAAAIITAGGLIHLAIFRNAPRHDVAPPPAVSAWQSLSGHFRHPAFRRIALVGAVLAAAQTTISIFWAIFVRRHFDVTVSMAVWSLFMVQISGALGRVALSALSDRGGWGRRRVVILCLALTPMALLVTVLLPSSHRDLSVLLCSAFTGFFCFGWYGPWIVWLSESVGREKVGEVIGAAMAISQVGIAAVPWFFGLAADAAGTPMLPLLCLVVMLGAVWLWDRVWPLRALDRACASTPPGQGLSQKIARAS